MVTKLYSVYRAELLNYCCLMCGNMEEAEDLLQETFVKALSNLDVLEDLEEKQQKAWLYKVARNLFYDACRRKAVERKHSEELEEETDGGFSEAETAMILAALPPDLSQIFIKRYFGGYNSRELAEEYGLSPSGIRAILSRARKILKEKLKDKEEEYKSEK
ncbi:MAG: RNA polymerase sigma factor [Oscillospiraceae bacterium]|nr:RNA polymerase sigma factor [Oscillospiraceae bacterium]